MLYRFYKNLNIYPEPLSSVLNSSQPRPVTITQSSLLVKIIQILIIFSYFQQP